MAQATTTIIRDTADDSARQASAERQVMKVLAEHPDSLDALLVLADALNESGLLEMTTALLRRGESVMDIVVHQAQKPEAAGAIKNLFALLGVLSQVNLGKISNLVVNASKAVESSDPPEVRGMFDLLKYLADPDVQRGMSLGFHVLKAIGQEVSRHEPGESEGEVV